MKAIRQILASIKRADKTYNFFQNNDTIAIGVSGGKDSMVLIYALSLYKKFSKLDFTIVPIMIDLGFDNFNPSEIINFLAKLDLNLKISDGKMVYQVLKKQQELQKLPHLPCSICSRMKKAIINKEAHNYNCNKVAFAHHKNDAIETLFLNEIYGARIATFSPKMFLSNENITFIRPLILCDEKIIKRAIKEENIPFISSNCPNDGATKRADIKEIITNFNKKYPESIDNFLTMLSNNEKEDLFYMHEEIKVEGQKENLFYKETLNINEYIKETKFNKNHTENYFSDSTDEENYKRIHLYKDNELVGFITFSKDERTFIIHSYNYLDYKDFAYFIFDFYLSLYEKYNPLKLFITSKNENFLKEIGFCKVFDENYQLQGNVIDIIIKRKRGFIF